MMFKTVLKSVFVFIGLSLLSNTNGFAQQNAAYWQQKVAYKMEIDMDVKTYQYQGNQVLEYTNNSPEALTKVYYHLYFNAFQPGSEMDLRLQTVVDPDGRMVNNLGTKEKPVYQSRISILKSEEQGFINVQSLKQNGKELVYEVEGTILEVQLANPILPGTSTTFEMDFLGQVPLQIRRSGRNNQEGVALSMTQWYPKIAEYDFEGWHADPYIGREFHGVWGDFNVNISIDKKYVLGGTGVLQNASEIGYGYEAEGIKVKRKRGKKLTWNFTAENVHDFAWAADPDFIHDMLQVPNGPKLHFLYKDNLSKEYQENWKKLQPKTVEMMQFYGEKIGPYPYPQYSVIQGGDGGMEYAMATLITGKRSYGSIVGVTAHELAHSWFQMILASNESQHPWMDEGFTSYVSDLCVHNILNQQGDPFENAYGGYDYLVKSGLQEPLSTHGDHYKTNVAYSIASYSMGELFLIQLGYIIGEANLATTLKQYYTDFKFKHPTPNDFIRVAEKVSGLELQWYLNEWTQTTHHIDYSVKQIDGKKITLERLGEMPMRLDVKVTYVDGTFELFNIPLRMMRGHKPTTSKVLPRWAWAIPTYTFEGSKEVKTVLIDPNMEMAAIHKVLLEKTK